MNRKLKRFLSMFLSLMMVFSLITYSPKAVFGATVSSADASAEATYGLQSNIQDGVILHCWDWSFNNIKANMAEIAAAGYSAIQTSPIQQAKETTKGGSNSHWWVLYQPATFNIDDTGNSALGTKAEFQAMVEEAHKYGVKVVVDIVANHTANNKGYDIASNVDSDIKNNASQTYHAEGFTEISDYTNRYRCTHYSMGGLPDLNTENSIVQGKVLGLLKECIDCGADGFRFDAAKHISIPAEGSEYTFWPNTLVAAQSYAKSTYGKDIYAYGEILDSAQVAIGGYTQYMSITDNGTSSTIMWGIKNGNAADASTSYYQKGEAGNKAVLWPESHDTYSNDGKETTNVDQQIMDKAWAMDASRANATSLYYARTPYRSGDFGAVHTYNWKDAEVVAANKFHNYFVGTSEYLGYDGSIAYNVRDKKGIVLVNCGGTSTSVNFSIAKTGMADGTYKDQVSGSTFTVSGGTISGNIGSTGVAVVYNADPIVLTPVATISQEGGNFSSDTLTLTVGLKNATSGTYKVGSGAAQTFTSSTTVTIGSGMSAGDSVTVTLTATDGTNNYSKAYTFKKVEKSSNIAYLALPSGWSDPYCYAYDSVTEVNNGTWPGVKMTKDSSTGYYMYEIPETITSPCVIFYSSDTNRYPADMQPGLTLTGSMIYKDGSWSAYTGGGGGGGTVTLPDVPAGYKRVFFKNTEGWSTVNYYNWITGTTTSVAGWPGSAMTVYDASQGIYYVDVNTSGGYNSIIFNNGTAKTDDLTVPSTDDNMFTFSSKTWSTFTVPVTATGKVIVNYVDESGKAVATSKTLTGNVGDAYTTSAATVSGYTLKTTPSNATGTYTKADITVNYVYSVVSSTDPTVTSSLADGSSFKTETQTITLTLKNAASGTYSVDNGPVKSFTGSASVVLGQGKVADSVVTVKATAKAADGTTKDYTFTYNKVFNGTVNEQANAAMTATDSIAVYNASGSALDSQYQTNPNGAGIKKTITVDGDISDWSSSMIIAQGAANDDPRVYRDNSMYEVPIDLYTLYGCYDDTNLYLMWEMTNVQDMVAPNDDYPISQGILYQTMNVPFFIAIDTGDSSSAIGNNCQTTTGGTLWGSNITITNSVNKVIAVSTNGANGPYVYGGTSAGLNEVEEYTAKTSGITFKYGLGILSSKIMGIDGAYGSNNNRVVGDMTKGSTYVDFKAKGHASETMDFHYEMSIPLATLGTNASTVASNGLGVLLIATMGKSGMDCLPYDTAMNDNADQPDTESQEFNSFEKSDADAIGTSFARIATGASNGGGGGEVITPTSLELNFGADRSAPQTAGTALTLKGIAKGGTAPYTYKFYAGSTLLGTKSGSGETSVAWTPTAGSYVIKCEVTDAAGKAVTSTKKYTVESSGGTVVITEGWQQDSTGWWYQNADGSFVKSDWKQISGTWYYFKADGYMVTGWQQIGGKWYYFNGSGAMKTGWQKLGGKWYYLDGSGAMRTGWQKLGGKWYYMDGSGAMRTGWQKLGGKWYYFDGSGAMRTGWQKLGGKWYYFDGSGAMKTGWFKSGSVYYYFKSDGSMAANEWVENNTYYLDADGKWVEGKTK